MFIVKKHTSEQISAANSYLISTYRLILSGLIFAIWTNVTLASDLYQYAMYVTPDATRDKCELKERYSLKNKNPLSISGKRNEHECQVSMPKKQYETRYQFCYLSGINLHKIKEGQSAECFIQERDDDYAFIAYIDSNNNPESQVMCYFTCFGKTGKIKDKYYK